MNYIRRLKQTKIKTNDRLVVLENKLRCTKD